MKHHFAAMDEPSDDNNYLSAHAALLLSSYRRLLGRDLLASSDDVTETAKRLFFAPFAVLSHDGADDPVLNYVNRYVMELWESDWLTLTAMPSRLTAEPLHRAQRAEFMQAARTKGFIEGYSGIRISTTGRRFMIEHATIWTFADGDGAPVAGQAATFAKHRRV